MHKGAKRTKKAHAEPPAPAQPEVRDQEQETPAAAADVEVEATEEAVAETDLERLEREWSAAQARASEYLDGWQRAQAEFSNYRKRQDAEWEQRRQMSNAVLLGRILPIVDDLGRAAETLPEGLRTLTWIEGVFLVLRKLEMVLESEGVQPIPTQEQAFDPVYHEAVTYEEADGYEDGHIIGEVQRGYLLGTRVIRPALVRVARARPQSAEADQEPESAEEQ